MEVTFGKETVVNPHLLNACACIDVIVLAREMVVSTVHPKNVPTGIDVTDTAGVTVALVKAVHWANENTPIDVTEEGIVTVGMAVPANAYVPIVVVPDGIVILVNPAL
jgi:hypothetical protein